MNKGDPSDNPLTVALQKAEQKLAERDALITSAIGQTETARAQYEQANERAETLRRRLEAKDEQLSALQKELQQRDERIATLEQQCAENDNALNAINEDVRRQNLANPSDQVAAMGLILESLDQHGTQHKIGRATTTFGRATENDIAINSTSVSRYHARIVVESDKVFLNDLESTNGCRINGRRVSRQIINDGDIVAIGDAKFRLTFGAPSAENEDRSMDETHAILDDSAIFSAASKSKGTSAQERFAKGRAKTK